MNKIRTNSASPASTAPEANGMPSLGILAEERFDRVTRIVARSLGVPVALFSLVEEDRQRFKSEVGLAEPWRTCRETPLSHSFCKYVVSDEATLRIEDARIDPRLHDNGAIADLNVIAYLGVPVRAPTGQVIGSLCAIDSVPREWTADDERQLRDLADIVEEYLGLSISEQHWRAILNTIPQIVWSTLPDGYHDFYNDRWYEFTGVPLGSTDGEGWNGMFHKDDQERAWAKWRHSLATGEPYEIEYRLRHRSGAYLWTLGRALPIRDENGNIVRWFGTSTDIDALKSAETERDLIAQELSHRIKNIFAVVGGLISSSSRGETEVQPFAQKVASRIQALALAHKYVESDSARLDAIRAHYDKTLHGLLETILTPYRADGREKRIVVEGCDIAIVPKAATSLALLLHELATNAVKYGALSRDDGTLRVECDRKDHDILLHWRERGGPQVEGAGTNAGFGSRLVEATVRQLGATLERQWHVDGLEVVIHLPEARLTGGEAKDATCS